MTAAEQVRILRERITDEIFLALGMSKTGILRRNLGWLFRLPTQRFASIFSSADQAAREIGTFRRWPGITAQSDRALPGARVGKPAARRATDRCLQSPRRV